MATIQIEVGNLSGFAVISLSIVALASEPVKLGNIPISNPDPNSFPD